MTPRATYRLQLHADFTFRDAEALAPYLSKLGVSHVYTSPITTARAGSRHGYDVVDPTRISEELGGEERFRAMVAALRKAEIGVVLDVVPNHMAVGGADNRWWLDVLEHGPTGTNAAFFDIDWTPQNPLLKGKVLAPFLGKPYFEALQAGEIVLKREQSGGRAGVLVSNTHFFPLRPEDQSRFQGEDLERSAKAYDPASPEGRSALHDLLETQHYRLAWWRTAGDEINWRRFFDITELAGVQVERPEVFETLLGLPLRLYAEGLIDGVRADHVDGLADPAGYCRVMRRRLEEAGRQRPLDLPRAAPYFVVEKILGPGERLSPEWGVDGTTGYEFMELVSALMHEPAGEATLNQGWSALSGRSARFPPEERAARPEILTRNFSAQLEACVDAFLRLARSAPEGRDLTAGGLRRALQALLTVFPCYRTYGGGAVVDADDPERLAKALERARPLLSSNDQEAVERICEWILGRGPGADALRAEPVRRFQQLSAPVSAKSVEDTAFYRYGRLLSRNDVGFDPVRFSISPREMHAASAERARVFPRAMLTTASHDHKRGEDVRARLAVLSERPEVLLQRSALWSQETRARELGVDPADEYALHQTLIGALPLEFDPHDGAARSAFETRVGAWQQKALREAKLRSSWAEPNEAYESACQALLSRCLDPAKGGSTASDLKRLVDEIAAAGALNSLTQTLLRCASPGVPDLYQGGEFWDFSLVDPDNRREVDYAARQSALQSEGSFASHLTNWRSGALKQTLIAEVLGLRRGHPQLFEDGAYQPLEVTGERSGHAIAFLRHLGADAMLFAAPLRCAEAVWGADHPLPPADYWASSALSPPDAGLWRFADGGDFASELPLAKVFAQRPWAAAPLRRA